MLSYSALHCKVHTPPVRGLSTGWESRYTYTPSDARAARALCCDDVRAERAPRVRGVHWGLRGTLGVHVAFILERCLRSYEILMRSRRSLRGPGTPPPGRRG